MEEWRMVVGYEGLYEVSNFGNVRSKRKILKQTNYNGYQCVCLSKESNRKIHKVHRLVAIAFIPNEENKREVNHIDEDKTNNHVSNLEWVTPKENINHGTCIKRRSKKHEKPVRCVETGEIFRSSKLAQEWLGIGGCGVNQCINGHRKACGGYHWEVVDNG